MIRHLHMKARLKDKTEDRRVAERKYKAACKIQGFVKGVWVRRWIRREKAALVIQKPLRFFLARKRWKREKKEQSLSGIRIFINSMISRVVINRTTYICRVHSQNMAKPQALVRGFIVRSIMTRAKLFAYKMGLVVVTIQRFWR